MSISRATQTVAAIELDMRDILRSKQARQSDAVKEPRKDLASLITQISSRSVHEIDHLIAGLHGLREKLNNDGDRLHRQIEQHASFSQSIVQLTEIISDGMASVKQAVPAPADVAQRNRPS
jgi:hypothetical protein